MIFEALLLAGFAAVLASAIYTCIYRLYLTPIARIPGPFLARLTYGYEFYYDVAKQGQYTWKIAELHERYGPILRINPHEVHIADSSFADTLYLTSSTSRTIDKFPFAARVFGNDDAFFGTVSHEHHKIRRNPMNRFFTKSKPSCNRLVGFLHEAKRSGEIVNLTQLLGGFTADVIADYAMGEPLGVLDDKRYARNWRSLWQNMVTMSGIAKQIPAISKLLRVLPTWATEMVDKNMAMINRWLSSVDSRLTKRRAEFAKNKSRPKVHYNLIDELLFGDLPAEERTNRRIVDEAQSLMGAGSVTTAEMLSSLSFHVLNDNGILPRLQDELLSMFLQHPNSQPRWIDLERLPYLTAIIRETLRHYYGVMQRSPRVHRDADLTYGGFVLPKGTPISTSAYVIHNDRAIYGADVDKFNPERWLIDDQELLARRERSLFSFGKGSRMCLGYQMAWAEMYLVCSAIFNPRSGFKMALHNTDIESVRVKHDFVVAYPSLASEGVQIKIQ